MATKNYFDVYCPSRLVDPMIKKVNSFCKFKDIQLEILQFEVNSIGEKRLTLMGNNQEDLKIVGGFCSGYIAAAFI
jgi:hypothetical protein